MKKLCILLTVIMLSVASAINAQDYHKLLDTGKVWHTVQIGEFGDILAYEMTPDFEDEYNANDTIYYSIDGWIIIREDTITKKVYKRNFADNNTPSGPEEIIYDFSLQEGDSIYIKSDALFNYNSWFFIDSVKILNILGTDRNVLYLRHDLYNNYPVWVEGIGSLSGIHIVGVEPELFVWGVGELTCCYHNDNLLYQSVNGEQWGCEFELVDQVPPVVDSIWYEEGTYTNTDSVTLYVKASDNMSGVSNYLVLINSPSGNYIEDIGMLTHVTDDIYYSKIRYNWNEIGNWYSDFIVVWDNAGYYTEKYFDYQASFYVNELNSVKENKITDIDLYPNPVSDISVLEFTNKKNETFFLNIYDMYGKSVYMQHTTNSHFKISNKNFSKGMYSYKLSNHKNIRYTNTFIIQ